MSNQSSGKQLTIADLVPDDQLRSRMKSAWQQRVRLGQAPTLASRAWLMAPLYQPRDAQRPGVRFWNNEHCRSREVPKVWARAYDEKGLGLPEILDRDILCFALWRMMVTGNRTVEIGLIEFRDFLVPACKRPTKTHYEEVIQAVRRLEANQIAWGTGLGEKDLEGETIFRGYAFESVSVPHITGGGQRIGALPVRMTISQDFVENMVEPSEWQYVCFRQYLSLAITPTSRRMPIARQVYLYLAANCKAVDEEQRIYICAFDLEDLQYRYEHLTHTRLKNQDISDRMVPRYRNPKDPKSRLGKVFKALDRAGVLIDYEVRQFRNVNQLVCSFQTDWGTKLAVQTNFIDRMGPRLSRTERAIGALPERRPTQLKDQQSAPPSPRSDDGAHALPERLQPIARLTGIYPSIAIKALNAGWTHGQFWRSQVTALYDYEHDFNAQAHELGSVAARRVTHNHPQEFNELQADVKEWARRQPWYEKVGGVHPSDQAQVIEERHDLVDVPSVDLQEGPDIVIEAVSVSAQVVQEEVSDWGMLRQQALIEFDYHNRSQQERASFDIWLHADKVSLRRTPTAVVLVAPTPLFTKQMDKRYGSYLGRAASALGWPSAIVYESR